MLSLNCDTDALADVANIVKKGGIIIYPTDTLYGIGCNPYDKEAVNKIFRLKKRSYRPLPILCSDIKHAEELVHLGDIGRMLASRFWPGSLTIVAKIAANNLPKELTGGSEGLGVRIPDHRGALKIISLCGGYLVGTSANISGSETPDTPEGIMNIFDEEFDVLIYGGSKPSGTQSTVVDMIGDSVRIIREGAVLSEELLQII